MGTVLSVFVFLILVYLVQKPIRKGVIGHTLMIEEAGRQKVNHEVKFLMFYTNYLSSKADPCRRLLDIIL